VRGPYRMVVTHMHCINLDGLLGGDLISANLYRPMRLVMMVSKIRCPPLFFPPLPLDPQLLANGAELFFLT